MNESPAQGAQPVNYDLPSLLEAGMHFGHLTRRWNPKMKPYIYGARHGIHIINLAKTVQQLEKALSFIKQAVGDGKDVIFVGTKRQAQDVIKEAAERCGMFYMNQRWLGGTLTNFRTIKASIDRLNTLQKKKEEGFFEALKKKERLMLDREIDKFLISLGGIQKMKRAPGVMVIIDPKMERIALQEAKVLGIPVVALTDTNCDPDLVDYVVPGNDDALRAVQIFVNAIAEQVLEGMKLRELKSRQETERAKEDSSKKGPVREVKVRQEETKAFVAKGAKEEKAEEADVESGQYSAKVEVEEKVEEAEEVKKSEEASSEAGEEK